MSDTLDPLQHNTGLSAQSKQKEKQMADESAWNVQANLKVGEHLFNIRGADVESVTLQLEQFATNADRIFEVVSIVKQVTMTKGLTNFTPAPAASAPVTQHSAPAAGATAGSLRCAHGAYKDMKGKRKKNGDPYQLRYYCPQFTGGCQAKDLPGQEAWS